jgi:NAD+ kinase
MATPFASIGVIARYDTPNVVKPLEKLVQYLTGRGLRVVMDSRSAPSVRVSPTSVVEMERIGTETDLVVVLGGDGTLLSVARILAPHQVPLIGINLGRLGFLTDIPVDSMQQMLGAVLDGAYSAEDRSLLSAAVVRGGKEILRTLALNDVVVSKGASGSMIEFEVYVDGQFAYNLRSDGLIIATPTGSTAYALSSGGPILHPTLAAMTLVPISPHTLSNRPIVLGNQAVLHVILVRGLDARANFDVQSSFDLEHNDKVLVTAYERPIRLLHPQGHSYYAMLREKLHWSAKL